jgi:hypothetical protein
MEPKVSVKLPALVEPTPAVKLSEGETDAAPEEDTEAVANWVLLTLD